MIDRAADQREAAERANGDGVADQRRPSDERAANEESRETAVSRAAFEEQWRVACPAGHVRLEPARVTETAYCESCERSYALDELVDRKRPATG